MIPRVFLSDTAGHSRTLNSHRHEDSNSDNMSKRNRKKKKKAELLKLSFLDVFTLVMLLCNNKPKERKMSIKMFSKSKGKSKVSSSITVIRKDGK